MDEKRSKQAIKASGKGRAEETIRPRKDKHIYSVYLNTKSYEELKFLHGRETSRIINDLIDSYLFAMREKSNKIR